MGPPIHARNQTAVEALGRSRWFSAKEIEVNCICRKGHGQCVFETPFIYYLEKGRIITDEYYSNLLTIWMSKFARTRLEEGIVYHNNVPAHKIALDEIQEFSEKRRKQTLIFNKPILQRQFNAQTHYDHLSTNILVEDPGEEEVALEGKTRRYDIVDSIWGFPGPFHQEHFDFILASHPVKYSNSTNCLVIKFIELIYRFLTSSKSAYLTKSTQKEVLLASVIFTIGMKL
ncbi:hypothetical protein LAZ67_13001046 [Cordylochernes scorpioides]|uniref:Transposase n=1 Tax=Cordylochernes scorpioides TaxID=51811 RepID=A0ABY6L5D6_9ARAC|nr:hypothetical protein LAZ67_13001046 [Cordylochernes scorpioides]